jgi:Cu/Ag efflux protein CusF
MRFINGLVVACAIATSSAAAAQVSKTLAGETTTVTATVEAIQPSSREVTLKKEDGNYEVLKVPTSVRQFDSLKVGDTLRIRYYENIVLRLKEPGEPDVDTTSKSATPAAGGEAAGTMAGQRTITATITAIDPKVPSITFTGPNKWSYSSRVEDTKALAKVKVGDRVDITWTAATLMSFEPMK